ncbi:hypothetical protein IVIADoCa2_16 [Xanthomonas phage vB_Xar_IVIA-DoCa2]|uniref:Uncharacterized protein n=1 Tax=Xanthomonas phage vB_Xar_IVIA-DoCa2 TaxID=2970491 RepID=A0A976SGR1_9CAUD|nr:hypothetical protein IVIADoCa2_16 [Xanthomonas phage vB_Xar_IVIA-DoCa2]
MIGPSRPQVQCAPAPSRSYTAATILRPGALVPGQYVTLLLGQDSDVASDGDNVFIVTDQKDKKGNPLLIERHSGTTVAASPTSVWAIW